MICISPRNFFMFTPMLPSTAVGTVEFRCGAGLAWPERGGAGRALGEGLGRREWPGGALQ